MVKHLIPCRLGVNDKVIPNSLLDFGHMPLFLVEHLIITFNPNGPQNNPSKKVPYLNNFVISFRNSFPEQGLFPIETIIITHSYPAKLMHDECCPSPLPTCLDAIP